MGSPAEQIGHAPRQPIRQRQGGVRHGGSSEQALAIVRALDQLRLFQLEELLDLSLHPLERGIHLLEHLLGGDAELAELGAQLLRRELGLEIFGEFKRFMNTR